MKGYEAYKLFRAISLHFTSEYDYFKYCGSLRIQEANFSSYKYRWQFEALESSMTKKEMLFYFYLTFKHNDFKFMNGLPFIRSVNKIRKINKNLFYDAIVDEVCTIMGSDILSKQGDLYPMVYELYKSSKVSLEALLLIDMYIKNVLKTDNSRDIIAWPNEVNRLNTKIKPFVAMFFDKDRFLSDITTASHT